MPKRLQTSVTFEHATASDGHGGLYVQMTRGKQVLRMYVLASERDELEDFLTSPTSGGKVEINTES